jgi:two-component system sensor histidine kinase DesK
MGRPELSELLRSPRLITLATVAAVFYSLLIPAVVLYLMVTQPIDPGRIQYAIPATASLLPLQIWLVAAAARGKVNRRHLLGLAVMTAITFGVLPIVGVGWLGMLVVPGALVLVYLRPPLSVVLFAILALVPAPLAVVLGHPNWAGYFGLAQVSNALPLAVALWLLKVAGQLQEARQMLADDAVLRERLRIDDELRRTIGAALEAITLKGERAGQLAALDPAAVEPDLRELSAVSRRTLTEARRLVTQFRGVSLAFELETAVTLLSAAGIDARVELPPTPLPSVVDEDIRAALRRDVAALLAGRGASTAVTIAVVSDGGRIRLETRPAEVGAR